MNWIPFIISVVIAGFVWFLLLLGFYSLIDHQNYYKEFLMNVLKREGGF